MIANAERIVPLKLLVRKLQYFLHKWNMLTVRAVSCTKSQFLMEAWFVQPQYEISIPVKKKKKLLGPRYQDGSFQSYSLA